MISVSEIELEAIVEEYDNAKKTAVAGVSVIIHDQREEVSGICRYFPIFLMQFRRNQMHQVSRFVWIKKLALAPLSEQSSTDTSALTCSTQWLRFAIEFCAHRATGYQFRRDVSLPPAAAELCQPRRSTFSDRHRPVLQGMEFSRWGRRTHRKNYDFTDINGGFHGISSFLSRFAEGDVERESGDVGIRKLSYKAS